MMMDDLYRLAWADIEGLDTNAGASHMPLYHFVVREQDFTHDDPEGVHLPNDDAARDQGQRIVQELKEDGYPENAVLIVRDERGEIVQSIRFR